MSTESDTAWIVKGAKVVVFRRGRTERYDNISTTTVKSVAKKSFTTEQGDRYNMATQTRPGPGSWSANYECVPADSDKGRDVMANARYQLATRKARTAIQTWERDRTQDNRLAAIAALQAIDETHA